LAKLARGRNTLLLVPRYSSLEAALHQSLILPVQAETGETLNSVEFTEFGVFWRIRLVCSGGAYHSDQDRQGCTLPLLTLLF